MLETNGLPKVVHIVLIMHHCIVVSGMDSVLPSTKPYIPRVGKVSSCMNLELMDKVCARSENRITNMSCYKQ